VEIFIFCFNLSSLFGERISFLFKFILQKNMNLCFSHPLPLLAISSLESVPFFWMNLIMIENVKYMKCC